MIMNQLQLFNYKEKELRILTDEKWEPRFIAKDVCELLGLANVSKAVSTLWKDDLTTSKVTDSLGREQETNIVSEAGMYKLIFQSRKSEAQEFQNFVTKEVLPQIRKTGTYSMQQLTPAQLLLSQAQILVQQEQRMNHIEQKVQHLEAKVRTSETDYYTISWYCAIKNKKVPLSKANLLGKKCAKLSRELDYEIGKVRDQKYGTVNTYHIDILEQVFDA